MTNATLSVPVESSLWYGTPRDFTEHYLKCGRYRGYLTDEKARWPAENNPVDRLLASA